jgi:glycosyltransferase involved in cell wall biosynthesis
MAKVLYVLPNLKPGGAAKQGSRLAAGLPRDRYEPRVCVLGKDGPLGDPLRAAGVPVEVLGWSRVFDPRPPRRLHQLLREFRPDVLHLWTPPAVRAVALVGGLRRYRPLVSVPLALENGRPRLRDVDLWLLRRAARVAVYSQAEAERCRRLGLAAERVVIVPPGAIASDEGVNAASGLRTTTVLPRLPDSARLLTCVGPLEPHKGFRDAVWAFDILRYLYDDLHLAIVGEGSDQGRLRQFVRTIAGVDRVHLPGRLDDTAGLLARSDLVLVPSLSEGGVNAALEAMAAGKAVIASRAGSLPEVVADGETGLLFHPGDKAGLARQVRVLLEDAGKRRGMGEAGRRRAAAEFGIAALVNKYVAQYDRLAPPA